MAVFPAKVFFKTMFDSKHKTSRKNNKSFVRLKSGQQLESYLETNDRPLTQLTQCVQNANALFAAMIGHEEESADTIVSIDFDGFEHNLETNSANSAVESSGAVGEDSHVRDHHNPQHLHVDEEHVGEGAGVEREQEPELSSASVANHKKRELNHEILHYVNHIQLRSELNNNRSASLHEKSVVSREVEGESGEMAKEVEAGAGVEGAFISKIQKLLKSQWEERLQRLVANTRPHNSEEEALPPHVDSSENGLKSGSKSILRKARLQISKKTLLRIRKADTFRNLVNRNNDNKKQTPSATIVGPHRLPTPSRPLNSSGAPPLLSSSSSSSSTSKGVSGQPGFITCVICNATKYYSHVQRRYGCFSCEPCSKFFARFIRDPKQFYCYNNGDCPISESHVSSLPPTPPPVSAAAQQSNKCSKTSKVAKSRPNVSAHRCKACWLKVCLQKFSIEANTRHMISNNYSPKLILQPNVSLITVDTSSHNNLEPTSRAPYLPTTVEKRLLMVAARDTTLPQQSYSSKETNYEKSSQQKSSRNGPRVKRVCRSAGVVKRPPRATFAHHSFTDSAHSSSDCDQRSETNDDSDELPFDIWTQRYSATSKAANGCQNTESFISSEKSRKTSPKKYRCKQCEGCRAEDCGQCNYCLDKKKFGGQNIIKACKFRTCVRFRSDVIGHSHKKEETTSDVLPLETTPPRSKSASWATPPPPQPLS